MEKKKKKKKKKSVRGISCPLRSTYALERAPSCIFFKTLIIQNACKGLFEINVFEFEFKGKKHLLFSRVVGNPTW